MNTNGRGRLKAAVSDSQQYGAVLEGLELITHLISRYAIVEQLYLNHQQMLSSGEIQRNLVELYSTVLLYLSKAKRYYEQSTASRFNESSFSRRSSAALSSAA